VHKKRSIIVVETDDLVRGLLEQWLGDEGYAVSVRALRTLTENRSVENGPSLLIVDVPNPKSAAAIIQALKQVYPSPVLVLSARFRRGLGASPSVANRLGVRKVLAKPFTREELLGAVNEAIAGA
jgi:DNA-binding response OmpR family regulator